MISALLLLRLWLLLKSLKCSGQNLADLSKQARLIQQTLFSVNLDLNWRSTIRKDFRRSQGNFLKSRKRCVTSEWPHLSITSGVQAIRWITNIIKKEKYLHLLKAKKGFLVQNIKGISLFFQLILWGLHD